MSASFNNPREVHAYLNQYVIGQEKAKKTLSVAMFNHHLRIQALDRRRRAAKGKGDSEVEDHVLQKANVLLIGPSGCGKTLLAQHLAKSCDLPFTIFDCSGLVKQGYVGTHSDSILEDLLAAANGDVKKAQHGVVVLDEIDKLRKASYGLDVAGIGAQQALLKLIEGKRVSIHGKFIDSTNVLFIAAGAFVDILDSIYHRLLVEDGRLSIKGDPLLLQNLLPVDLITYGMIPELVGRIPVVVKLDPWNIELLMEVLTGTKSSILKQYQWLFKAHKVGMNMTPEAIREVALQAIKQKTGARGLRTIMEDVLQEAMYEVPASDVQSFVVTAENVRKEEEIQYQREEAAAGKNGLKKKREKKRQQKWLLVRAERKMKYISKGSQQQVKRK